MSYIFRRNILDNFVENLGGEFIPPMCWINRLFVEILLSWDRISLEYSVKVVTEKNFPK